MVIPVDLDAIEAEGDTLHLGNIYQYFGDYLVQIGIDRSSGGVVGPVTG